MLYYVLAVLYGVVVKIYDDIYDNQCLIHYKNQTFMEILKGFQYILFTALSLKFPLFCICFNCIVFANFMSNNEAHREPYEKSLFLSNLCLLIIIFVRNNFSLIFFDDVTMNYCDYLGFLLFGTLIGFFLFIEPLIESYLLVPKEFNYFKIYQRLGCTIWSLFVAVIIKIPLVQFIALWLVGYTGISTIVQIYSVNKTFNQEFEIINDILVAHSIPIKMPTKNPISSKKSINKIQL